MLTFVSLNSDFRQQRLVKAKLQNEYQLVKDRVQENERKKLHRGAAPNDPYGSDWKGECISQDLGVPVVD